jgi:hypothetical protein
MARLRPLLASTLPPRFLLSRGALLAALAIAAPACDDAPVKKPASTAIDPSEQAQVEKSRHLIDEANRQMAAKRYDDARKFLKQAAALQVESQRYEIEETVDKLDKHQAKLWANEVADKLKDKDCAGAFKALATPIHERAADGEAFIHELRHLIGAAALKCVQDSVDASVLAGKFADARALVTSDDAKAVLGPTAAKKMSVEIEATITDALRGQLADDLKAHHFQQAVDKLDAAVKRGDAGDDQVPTLLGAIRDAAAPEIAALAQRGIGARDAAALLKEVDALIKLLRWEIVAGDVAALEQDKALPHDLGVKRQSLAIWVEAQRIKMKPLKTPDKRWTHGKVMVFPPSKSDGDSKRDLPGATPIWILGLTHDRALITDSDPGAAPLQAMLDKVVGWVALDRLATESTIDWLPPDDQLKGERVWGPLRPPDTIMELGTVLDVQGKDISVKRLADDVVLKLTRKQLRSGRLAPGTRVITFCTAKDQPAKVAEALPAGNGVKLKCDGGQEKEEMLLSLRSRPELLPAGK